MPMRKLLYEKKKSIQFRELPKQIRWFESALKEISLVNDTMIRWRKEVSNAA
jgi:hypothetical protein